MNRFIKFILPITVRNHLRFLKHPIHAFLRFCIVLKCKKKILSGPFAGTFFDIPDFNTAMMIGTWEKELHDFFFNLEIQNDILCIGAAEGYYAVGLAKSFPDFEIYAYESNPIYLEFLKDNATKNDCANINYYGLCDRVELQKRLSESVEKPLIICDIEGGEIDILDIEKIPLLANAKILVEVHEMYVEKCEKKLLERFSKTHFAKVIKGEKRTINDLPNEIKFIKLFASESRVVNLMNEGRPYPMNWIFFNPLENLNA